MLSKEVQEFVKSTAGKLRLFFLPPYSPELNADEHVWNRHDFEKLSKIYHTGQKFRSFNRWSQLIAILVWQITGRKSLRDLVSNLSVQRKRCYHLGVECGSRGILAKSE